VVPNGQPYVLDVDEDVAQQPDIDEESIPIVHVYPLGHDTDAEHTCGCPFAATINADPPDGHCDMTV
jgi:hypothetical protein